MIATLKSMEAARDGRCHTYIGKAVFAHLPADSAFAGIETSNNSFRLKHSKIKRGLKRSAAKKNLRHNLVFRAGRFYMQIKS
jgi:hypothetical protein